MVAGRMNEKNTKIQELDNSTILIDFSPYKGTRECLWAAPRMSPSLNLTGIGLSRPVELACVLYKEMKAKGTNRAYSS